jgi:hypothetical protein
MEVISIKELAGEKAFLSGLGGKWIYPKLVASIDHREQPSVVFLDFAGITVSGSFFSQAILPLRVFARRMNAYLVLSNLNPDSLDELGWLLDIGTDAVYICELDQGDGIKKARWIGNLDPKQRLTLQALISEKECDAGKLAELFPGEDIRLTGWNNRLAALAKKGLAMEIKDGRSKRYRPVLGIES